MSVTETRLHLAAVPAARQQPRVFYGWWIVATCVVLLTLTSGIGFYGLGVFLPVLEREFRVSPTLVSIGTTAFFIVFGLAGPYAGRLADRFGPRIVMAAGSVVFGTGLVLMALAQTLWQTYLAYVVIAVGFAATGLVTVGALISVWFHARRGLAMSLAMTGLSIGGVLMVPLATRLIVDHGWRLAALALAALVWAIGIPVAALLIRRPADMGLLPDGAAEDPAGRAQSQARPASRPNAPTWTLAAARRTRAFWVVTAGYLLVYLAQTGVLVHQIRFLTLGTAEHGALTPESAAFAVSITALASIGGRLALGAILDRLDRRWVAVTLIALQAAATAGLLLARGNLALVYLAVLAFGLCMGCVLMLHTLLVSDLFGVASFGAIYGATLLVTQFGTAGGPWLASLLFDWFGGYEVAFGLFAIMGLLAAAIIAQTRPPQAPAPAVPVGLQVEASQR